MREAGALVLERAIASGKHPAEDKKLLKAAITTLRDATADTAAALAVVDDPALTTLLHARPVMSLITVDAPRRLLVERQRAGVGSWYEFFPRSEGATRRADGTIASGTFATAQKRLPQVAGMGFDVVYLPPIHPIGAINRKGPNNTLTTVEGDPGSPWAIGSAAGGHAHLVARGQRFQQRAVGLCVRQAEDVVDHRADDPGGVLVGDLRGPQAIDADPLRVDGALLATR